MRKYTLFLGAFLTFFLLEPVLDSMQRQLPLAVSLGVVLLILTLYLSGVLNIKSKSAVAAVLLAFAGLLIEHLNHAGDLAYHSHFFSFLGYAFYFYFAFYSVKELLVKLFTEKSVGLDTMAGGIFVYFLIGILWVVLYRMVLQINPAAFDKATGGALFYFSYTTLTTLGYGDILPISHYARILATLEAIVGQIFLAIFIGRLVGLYITQEVQKS